jgi:O-antigen/teichoic acid export membrane protein
VYAALLVVANGVANLVNFGYMLHILHAADVEAAGESKDPSQPTRAPLDLRRHIKPLMTFFIIVAAISVYTALDTVMLGFLSTEAQTGFYTADVIIKNALVSVVSALSAVLLPRASNLLANGKDDEWRRIIRKAIKYVLAFSVPVCVVGALLAQPAMTWYAGESFTGAGPALVVVVLAVIPIGLSVIFCDEVMVPLGMEQKCTYIYIGAAVLDFVLNLVLIPPLGALGAALSTACVELLITVVEFIIVRTYLGISGGQAL